MPIWFRRNLLAVTATLAFTLALVPPGHAQDHAQTAPGQGQPAPVEPPTTAEPSTAAEPPAGAEQPVAEPAPEQEADSTKDKTVAAFTDSLKLWTNQIKALEQAIADGATTDEELRAIPEFLETLREAILEQKGKLKPKLQDMRERLAKLGPAPEKEGPKESPEIAAQRERLEANVATIDGKLKQADILFVRADQLIDAANDKRRERFTESLFRPVPNFYSSVLPAAFERVPLQLKRLFDIGAEWISRAWDKGIVVFLLIFLVPVGAAVAGQSFVRNMAGRVDAKQRANKPAEPTVQQCGVWALRKTVRSALPLWLGLLVFYLIVSAAGLADPTINGFLLRALLATGWAIFLIALITHSLLPEESGWKIIPATDAVAWRVAGLLWAITAVWWADLILNLTDTAVFTPYHVSVLRSAVFAALYGVLLAAILLAIQSGKGMRKAALSGWRGWLFTFVGVQAGVILLAMLLGYESFARFLGMHAVSTAGVLWIMYLLHLAAESISSVSVISGRTIDDDRDEEEDMGAPSLLTIRIIVSLLLDIAIIAIGVTVLLLLWRFDWVEVKGWIQAAFFGFQFGNLHLSLQSVLIALGVFAFGLALTRFVQRWLTGRVFAGRHSESGLHESVRIGIGYLGFVLAALAGISYLGVDFSNLAIVAGALSVGIGFGLQSIFNNFVSGLIILVERPIKIGDYIQVGGLEGTVKKISVRSTEIETIYRQSVIIPNANLITDPVTNWMHLDRSCRLDIAVGVDYGTDVELLRTTLLGVAQHHRGVLKSPPPVVHFAGFGDSALDFELRVFLRDVGERIRSSSDLRFAILTALRDAGIVIPFPQRDLHIKGGGFTPPSAPAAKSKPAQGSRERGSR
jgi:small-conductance mechanosensitive channel